MPIIDIQQMASNFYQTVLNLNQSATELIGLECIYCRLLPHQNSEDVIVQEYTLHNYDCPKKFKVVTNKTDYQIGNFSIDAFGIHSEAGLEISIDITTWENTYGKGTMPQKGDFILIEMLHKPFEITSSSIVYTIGEHVTSYKCALTDWKRNANRAEAEDFTYSIDKLTDSQDRLFGEQISKEVADAVVEVETAYNTTTYVDPIKDFDINSIVMEDILIKGHVISPAYYDFSNASRNIFYKINAIYNPVEKENHWIYSCWFKQNQDSENIDYDIKINNIELQEKDFWWFSITTSAHVKDGDEVVIYRGSALKLKGIIEQNECNDNLSLRIETTTCLKANKKVQNWWKNGIWKIAQNTNSLNLLTCYDNEDSTGNIVFKLDIDKTDFIVRNNNLIKSVALADGKSLKYNYWHYLVVDMSPTDTKIILSKASCSKNTNKYIIKEIANTNISMTNKAFEFKCATIENKGTDIQMCNIRLYENAYALDNTYKQDMFSEVTRNASKLILVDTPRPENKMTFITPIR